MKDILIFSLSVVAPCAVFCYFVWRCRRKERTIARDTAEKLMLAFCDAPTVGNYEKASSFIYDSGVPVTSLNPATVGRFTELAFKHIDT